MVQRCTGKCGKGKSNNRSCDETCLAQNLIQVPQLPKKNAWRNFELKYFMATQQFILWGNIKYTQVCQLLHPSTQLLHKGSCFCSPWNIRMSLGNTSSVVFFTVGTAKRSTLAIDWNGSERRSLAWVFQISLVWITCVHVTSTQYSPQVFLFRAQPMVVSRMCQF